MTSGSAEPGGSWQVSQLHDHRLAGTCGALLGRSCRRIIDAVIEALVD
jgi:hypothetical protein